MYSIYTINVIKQISFNYIWEENEKLKKKRASCYIKIKR